MLQGIGFARSIALLARRINLGTDIAQLTRPEADVRTDAASIQ
jgi:hypothetical protein